MSMNALNAVGKMTVAMVSISTSQPSLVAVPMALATARSLLKRSGKMSLCRFIDRINTSRASVSRYVFAIGL